MNPEARRTIVAMLKGSGLSELEQRAVLEQAEKAAESASGMLAFAAEARGRQWDSKITPAERRIATALTQAGDVLLSAAAGALPDPGAGLKSEREGVDAAIADIRKRADQAPDGHRRELERQIDSLRSVATQIDKEQAAAAAGAGDAS